MGCCLLGGLFLFLHVLFSLFGFVACLLVFPAAHFQCWRPFDLESRILPGSINMFDRSVGLVRGYLDYLLAWCLLARVFLLAFYVWSFAGRFVAYALLVVLLRSF